jgi:hypothetical protein
LATAQATSDAELLRLWLHGRPATTRRATCKLNRVNPQTYFTDLLTRLVNGWPQSRIDELMPWHWTPQTVH